MKRLPKTTDGIAFSSTIASQKEYDDGVKNGLLKIPEDKQEEWSTQRGRGNDNKNFRNFWWDTIASMSSTEFIDQAERADLVYGKVAERSQVFQDPQVIY